MSLPNLKNTLKQILSYLRISLFLLIFFTLIQSCSDSSKDPVNTYDYLPLAVGQFQVYEVTEDIYSSGQNGPVKTVFQERDEITAVTTNGNGTSTYVVSRSSRKSSSEYWTKIKEYSIEQFPDKLIFNTDNKITVPLVFPIDSKVIWNGNMYNNQDKKDYRYEDISQPLQLGSLSFDNTLSVIEQRDTTSVIDYTLSLKRYALGVGLIYDEQTVYQYCQSSADCIGLGIIDSGSKRTRKILEHGSF